MVDGTTGVYSISDGTDTIYVNPSATSASHNLVSWSWNDWNGTFHDERLIAQKMKIIWKFEADETEEGTVAGLGNITTVAKRSNHTSIMEWLMNKINANHSRFFIVNSWVSGLGWKKGKMYLGTPTNLDAEGIKPGSSKEMAVSKLELHWIEVPGGLNPGLS